MLCATITVVWLLSNTKKEDMRTTIFHGADSANFL